MLKDCVFGLNVFNERIFRFKKVVSGTEFNTVGAIISTLLAMGRLKKGCLRLYVFVQLSSGIHSGMKKY